MSELTRLTIAEARDGLAAKSYTAEELTQAHLNAMEATRDLNAFVTETPEIALQRAKNPTRDARRAKSQAAWMAFRPR